MLCFFLHNFHIRVT